MNHLKRDEETKKCFGKNKMPKHAQRELMLGNKHESEQKGFKEAAIGSEAAHAK